jgi:hypothetical protein
LPPGAPLSEQTFTPLINILWMAVTAAFTHWGMYNIPLHITTLPENAGVPGSPYGLQVVNDFFIGAERPLPSCQHRPVRSPIYGVRARYRAELAEFVQFSGYRRNPLSGDHQRGAEPSYPVKRQFDRPVLDNPVAWLGLIGRTTDTLTAPFAKLSTQGDNVANWPCARRREFACGGRIHPGSLLPLCIANRLGRRGCGASASTRRVRS